MLYLDAQGGYRALHSVLDDQLAEHDSSVCRVCVERGRSEQRSDTGVGGRRGEVGEGTTGSSSSSNFIGKFASFSSVFKSRSADLKGKLVDYINNPNGEEGNLRHASPTDSGASYRGTGDVFSIGDEETSRIVNLTDVLSRPDTVTAFACHQVRENGYLFPCQLVLTEASVLLIRLADGEPSSKTGEVVVKRSLASIMKITSKKKRPDLITFKYGYTDTDGDCVITDLDRCDIFIASLLLCFLRSQNMYFASPCLIIIVFLLYFTVK